MPFADAPGARIYYEAHGAGDPLLIIPGFGSNGTLFRKNIPLLAERLRVIVMDPRGSGRSDVPESAYTMEQLADDAASVLDAASVASADVFGTSLGGMIAQHVALRHPARVRRLVLGCTAAGGAHYVQPDPQTIVTFIAASEISDPIAAVRSTYAIHYSSDYTARHDEELVAFTLEHQELRSTPAGRAGQLAAASAHDTYDRLPLIAAPTLVAHGAEDPLVRVENARVLSERIPKARLTVYPGAKHIFFVECADQLSADMIAFLSEEGEEAAA